MVRGGAVIASTMLIIGTLYASGASSKPAGRWAIIVLIYLFVIGFTCTWAIVIRIICSELQPTRTRAAVSSFGQCVNWVRVLCFSLTVRSLMAWSSRRSSTGSSRSRPRSSSRSLPRARTSSSEAAPSSQR